MGNNEDGKLKRKIEALELRKIGEPNLVMDALGN